MKNSRPIVLLSMSIIAAGLLGGCATMPARRQARMPQPVTYAVIAIDQQGVLSQADFRKIEVGVIQYLLDEGYVRPGEKYVTDVMHADIVFRVRIAWQGKNGGFAVTEVVPSFSGAPASQTYGGGGSAAYAPAYASSPWYYDPWWYDDYYGSSWWPYGVFAGVLPFAPIYGGGHPHHARPDHDRDGPRRGDRDHDRDGHAPPGDYAGGWHPRWHGDAPRGVGPLRPDHDSDRWRPTDSNWNRPGPRPPPGERHRWHFQPGNPDHVAATPRPNQARQFRPADVGRSNRWAERGPGVMDRRPERFSMPAAVRAPAPTFSAPARSFSPPPPPPASAPPARERNDDSNSRDAKR